MSHMDTLRISSPDQIDVKRSEVSALALTANTDVRLVMATQMHD